MRAAAMAALERLDASDKVRRALAHDFRESVLSFLPGEVVYFWRKARSRGGNIRGRGSRLFDRWHGPGVILGRESDHRGEEHEGYWVSYSGELL